MRGCARNAFTANSLRSADEVCLFSPQFVIHNCI